MSTLSQQDGRTPLFTTSGNGHIIVAELLLKNGANVNLQEKVGITDNAVQIGNILILHSL